MFDAAMGIRPDRNTRLAAHLSGGLGWRLDTGPYKYLQSGMATGVSLNVSSGLSFRSASGRDCSVDAQLGLASMTYEDPDYTFPSRYLRTELMLTGGFAF